MTGRVSRDRILRRERKQGNNQFPCLADHEKDWQSYPVDHRYSLRDIRIWTVAARVALSSSVNLTNEDPRIE